LIATPNTAFRGPIEAAHRAEHRQAAKLVAATEAADALFQIQIFLQSSSNHLKGTLFIL
jgi:hypothetical protein